MVFNIKSAKLVLISIFLISISGCVSVKTIPLTFKEDNKISVMPLLDIRKNKPVAVAASDIMVYGIKRPFLMQGFEVDMPNYFSEDNSLQSLQVAEMEVDELAKLGPSKSKALLYLYLNNIDITYAGVYATVNVDITASLVQKNPPKLLWRYNATESSGVGGLQSSFVIESFVPKAITDTIVNLSNNVPDITKIIAQ